MHPNLKIERFDPGQDIKKGDDKHYRSLVRMKDKYCYRVIFKFSDLFVISDKDIYDLLGPPLIRFYDMIEKVINDCPLFKKSLKPIKVSQRYPRIIKEMQEASMIFDVGPMASVAGAVCQYLANKLSDVCETLIIENGGDIYVKDNKNVKVSLFMDNQYFNHLLLEIDRTSLPASICSSSGKIGHSLSFGFSDLVTVTSGSAIMADTAATAIANTIRTKDDIQRSMDLFTPNPNIDSIVSIKDDVIGIWGKIKIARR